jgi:riboflavin synthase
MFTGIIEELGRIAGIKKGARSAVLRVDSTVVVSDVKLGDSISVNGVCLTVVDFTKTFFSAEVMAETLRRSNLGGLKTGGKVNLERALRPTDRLGGHFVSGHIDGVGAIKSIVKEDIADVFTISAPASVLKYVIEKGSIAIDGISLTVVDLTEDAFRVSLIPHTSANTTLGFKKAGDTVNLESDLIAKYIERLLKKDSSGPEGDGGGGIDQGFLARHGFF